MGARLNESQRVVIACRPFLDGDDKSIALKPLEEAAEAFGAWQNAMHGDGDLDSVIYECCDTIQAAVNLMMCVGATDAQVESAMDSVEFHNRKRGRYGE